MSAQYELPGTEALVKRTPNPLEILQAAVDKNLNPETLKQLMDLQERWEANEARKEFVEAMNSFKRNPPEILKNKHVKAGQIEYDHATLDHVCEQITQALSAHGISHRWAVEQTERTIKVSCILTHERGHSEKTTLEGPADSSGSKNAIQAIASSVTYLQRYTLLAATGLAAKNGDNDGAGSPKLADLQERLGYFAKCLNNKEVDAHFQASYQEASKLKDFTAMKMLVAAKDSRKAQLQ